MISAELVDRLNHLPSNGLPVLSAYVRVDPADASHRRTQSSVASMLHELRGLIEDPSLGREEVLSLRGDLEQIATFAAEGNWEPHAVALFSCSGRGLFEQVVLPRALRDRFVVDKTPWTRPLVAVLDDYHRSVVVVVDRSRSWYWELFQDELREMEQDRDPVLRKPNYPGWHGLDEYRTTHKAGELEKRHFGRTAEMVTRIMQSDTYDVTVIGGHHEVTERFLEYLPKVVRARVAGQFTVDPQTMTRADIRREAGEILDRYEREEETRLVEEVLGRAASGRLGVTGLDTCLWAGSVSAIQQLLVHDDTVHPGVICDTCGWMGLDAESCPVSGDKTRETPDIVDELAAAVIDHGGNVEHVLADTPLRGHLVAASLRFPLPPVPA